MKIKAFFFICVFTVTSLVAQSIQSPSEFLGYPIGTEFTRHHKVVEYFTYVSKTLNNVVLEQYGETNERRPLYVSYISSPENIKNLEAIRTANKSQTQSGNSTNETAIVWMSYNVHGNEASSTEAAMQTLYELVTQKQAWLKNTVVIIDPCINPDGRDRYVNWFNQVRSKPYNPVQMAKEHQEPWPGGRPNHYLFDLNRDWAWATQVESTQRLKIYNKWMPHIHVDFHEQYINDPYYFAPAAEPFHEIITDWQRDFQTQIGKNHARYFDKEGWLYFTKESFDLLYPSYGDTYPTYMGAIGMTYEQAGHGMAGLGITTDRGHELTLVDRLTHHKTTGLSTVEMASKNAVKLNTEFKKFFDNSTLIYKSYVLENSNTDKTQRLIRLLNKHEIEFEFSSPGTVKGYDYTTQKEVKKNSSGNDLVIHTDQPKGKMVKALFEPNAKLSDSLTYDITAWSLPYAHGFEAIASKTKVNSSKKVWNPTVSNTIDKGAYAYLAKWNSLEDGTFLAQLLKENIRVRLSEKAFTVEGKSYDAGSLLVLRTDNTAPDFDAKAIAIANRLGRTLTPVQTGFVSKGKDFGSYSVYPINKQHIAVLSGKGTSSLNFGEIWHFFETQLQYPLTILDTENFSRVRMTDIDVLIVPEGYYSMFNESTLTTIKEWTRSGGTLIALGAAVGNFAGKKGFSITRKTTDTKEGPNLTPYADVERQSANDAITGSIFKSTVDVTHPLAFGFGATYFSLKRGSASYELLKDGSNVAYFADDATNISGFAGKNALQLVPQSLLIGEQPMGRGSVIYMTENHLFRSFWDNGKRFFVNALFLRNSSTIKN